MFLFIPGSIPPRRAGEILCQVTYICDAQIHSKIDEKEKPKEEKIKREKDKDNDREKAEGFG